MTLYLIACLDKNNAIGYHNRLLFHLQADMTQFRQATTGHTILMGRKTFESLPHGALPHRRNIVISHQDLSLQGCDVYHSIDEALDSCQKEDTVFVIGGASIYEQTIGRADRLYLTEVEETCQQADSHFPQFNKKEWNICSSILQKEKNKNTNRTYTFSFRIYERKIKSRKIAPSQEAFL